MTHSFRNVDVVSPFLNRVKIQQQQQRQQQKTHKKSIRKKKLNYLTYGEWWRDIVSHTFEASIASPKYQFSHFNLLFNDEYHSSFSHRGLVSLHGRIIYII